MIKKKFWGVYHLYMNQSVFILVFCRHYLSFITGLLRSLYAGNAKPDYIPVDICIKGIIVASWYEATQSKRYYSTEPSCLLCNAKYNYNDCDYRSTACEIAIYNSSGRLTYTTTLENFTKISLRQGERTPMAKQIWYPYVKITKCQYWNYINVILYQVLPAIFIDSILFIAQKKPL